MEQRCEMIFCGCSVRRPGAAAAAGRAAPPSAACLEGPSINGDSFIITTEHEKHEVTSLRRHIFVIDDVIINWTM